MRVRRMTIEQGWRVGIDRFPNFHRSGSIKGMKKLYYGKDCLLIRCGSYIYDSIMYETDFPEYGQQCELVTPWRGYHRGTIVGRTAKGFIVQFSSGAEIEVYDDEIEFD